MGGTNHGGSRGSHRAEEVRLSGTAATRCEPQTRLSIRRPVHCGRHQSLVVSICKRPRRGVLLGGVQAEEDFENGPVKLPPGPIHRNVEKAIPGLIFVAPTILFGLSASGWRLHFAWQ